MTLKPYGSADQAANLAKVGKNKTPRSLAERMPSADVAAKVGLVTITAGAARRVTRRKA